MMKKNPQYNLKYKKIQNNRSINNIQKKKKQNKDELSAYDEIISRAKNTINIFQKQLEQTIPSIINYENNINNLKSVKSYRNINQASKKHIEKSVKAPSGSSIYFQPILTNIENLSKEQIKSQNLDSFSSDKYALNPNVDNYYIKLYHQSKNENIKLKNRINELEKINVNNERIISDYKNEQKYLLERIKELESIINEFENQNNSRNIMENSSEKHDFSNIKNNDFFYYNEKNRIIQENEKLKNEIRIILKDNNDLKLKIKSIEKINNISVQNININNPQKIKNNNNSGYNKSFRVLSNLTLYNRGVGSNSKIKINKMEGNLKIKDYTDKRNLSSDTSNKKNIIILKDENNNLKNENIELNKVNNILKNKINNLLNKQQLEEENKDLYINDLEEEQKQNLVIFNKIKEENNNLLNQINELKKEINNININKNNEISKLNIEIESLNKEKEILKKNESNELRSFGNNARALEEKLALSNKEIEKLKDYQNKYNSLCQIVDNLKIEIEELTNQNIELKKINEENDKEINNYMKNVNNLEIEILKIKQELIEENNKNKNMNKKY